jgi:hypothetical protein
LVKKYIYEPLIALLRFSHKPLIAACLADSIKAFSRAVLPAIGGLVVCKEGISVLWPLVPGPAQFKELSKHPFARLSSLAFTLLQQDNSAG